MIRLERVLYTVNLVNKKNCPITQAECQRDGKINPGAASWCSRPHLSGVPSLIYPDVSMQGLSSSKQMSSSTPETLRFFHHKHSVKKLRNATASGADLNFGNILNPCQSASTFGSDLIGEITYAITLGRALKVGKEAIFAPKPLPKKP
jgi:hypothetical protein